MNPVPIVHYIRHQAPRIVCVGRRGEARIAGLNMRPEERNKSVQPFTRQYKAANPSTYLPGLYISLPLFVASFRIRIGRSVNMLYRSLCKYVECRTVVA